MLSNVKLSLVVIFVWFHPIHAQSPEVSPDRHVTIWYPTAREDGTPLLFNANDTLVMSYETQWRATDASMWCLTDSRSVDAQYTGQDLDSPSML